MAKCTVSLCKKSHGKQIAASGAKAVGDSYLLLDNEDGSVTVHGVDSAGNPVPIDSVATITATSSDSASLTVDAPISMTFKVHALKPTPPGSPVKVAIVATFNAGTPGPFTFDLPCNITGTVATGLSVDLGVPVVR